LKFLFVRREGIKEEAPLPPLKLTILIIFFFIYIITIHISI
jgi:hypothetical protein